MAEYLKFTQVDATLKFISKDTSQGEKKHRPPIDLKSVQTNYNHREKSSNVWKDKRNKERMVILLIYSVIYRKKLLQNLQNNWFYYRKLFS